MLANGPSSPTRQPAFNNWRAIDWNMDWRDTGMTGETERLAALHALDLLDSAPEREFDALAALAAEMLSCPTAMITLVDHDRQWVKAQAGGGDGTVPRSDAFCNHTIRQAEPMVVADATTDPRFIANPFVTGPAALRFYAGAPIHAKGDDGAMHAVGAICVIDSAPRSLSAQGKAALGHLAALAEVLIAARATAIAAVDMAAKSDRQAGALERQQRIFKQAERIAMIGSWRLRLEDRHLSWSDQVFRIHGLPIGQFPSLGTALDFYPPTARAMVAAKLAAIIETGEPFDFDTDFLTAAGEERRVRSLAEVEYDADGQPVALVGVFQDITTAHRLKEQLRHSADTDFLTGIANRAAFQRALEAAIERSGRSTIPLAVAVIDLDGFKQVNDNFGHATGDDALRAVAGRLGAPWLAGCFAARLGGDEFALIVEDAALITDPAEFTARLDEALRISLTVQGMAVWCSGSVGLAFHRQGEPTRSVLRRADNALYAAKRERVGRRRAA